MATSASAIFRRSTEGLGALARRLGMTIAGGDIVRSPQGLVLHVTALGETRGRRVLTRSGANAGDLIGVTGTLGASAAGLRLLGLDADDPRRRAATADQLIEAHLRPEPRVALGAALLEHGATSAMDLSDGLLGDLPKILAASGVAARLDEGAIPVAAAVRALFPDEWLDLALRGGEDYELLFTAPRHAWDAIEAAARQAGGTVTAIGEIVARGSGRSEYRACGSRWQHGARFLLEHLTTSERADGCALPARLRSGASAPGRPRGPWPRPWPETGRCFPSPRSVAPHRVQSR